MSSQRSSGSRPAAGRAEPAGSGRHRGADPAQTFERLAAFGRPPTAELLSAIGAGVADQPASSDCDCALDELGRRLFGLAHEDAGAAAARLGELVAGDPGFIVDQRDPRGFLLDWVLARRIGHPLLLALVMAEAGCRAGLRTGVFSSGNAWYAGVRGDDDGLWLVVGRSAPLVDPTAQALED